MFVNCISEHHLGEEEGRLHPATPTPSIKGGPAGVNLPRTSTHTPSPCGQRQDGVQLCLYKGGQSRLELLTAADRDRRQQVELGLGRESLLGDPIKFKGLMLASKRRSPIGCTFTSQ